MQAERNLLNPFPNNNFKFDEYIKESSKWVKKNAVGIGEIARYKQFLLFPQCYKLRAQLDLMKSKFKEI